MQEDVIVGIVLLIERTRDLPKDKRGGEASKQTKYRRSFAGEKKAKERSWRIGASVHSSKIPADVPFFHHGL